MVVQLADEVVAGLPVSGNRGVAEEAVRGELHGALAVDDALTLVGVSVTVRQVRRVGGARLFLDLEKEWVLGFRCSLRGARRFF